MIIRNGYVVLDSLAIPLADAAALGIPERVVRWVQRSAHGEATR